MGKAFGSSVDRLRKGGRMPDSTQRANGLRSIVKGRLHTQGPWKHDCLDFDFSSQEEPSLIHKQQMVHTILEEKNELSAQQAPPCLHIACEGRRGTWLAKPDGRLHQMLKIPAVSPKKGRGIVLATSATQEQKRILAK